MGGRDMSSQLKNAAKRARDALCLMSNGKEMDAVALNDLIHQLDNALAIRPTLTNEQKVLLDALKDGPRRVSELDLTINRKTILKVMEQLLDRRLIHIQSSVIGMGPVSRVIAKGPRPSKPASKPRRDLSASWIQ